MRDPQLPDGMPDYFNTAIAFAAANLLWILFVVWILFGMVPVLVLAVLANHLITRLDIRLKSQKA